MHMSLCFFANDLKFILYLFYTIEMMLDKKKIQAIFLFKFKMGHKAGRQLSVSMHLAQDLLMNTEQWWFQKPCKGGGSSRMRSIVAGRQKCQYNYWMGCRRTQCQPFQGRLVLEANWKSEKAQ